MKIFATLKWMPLLLIWGCNEIGVAELEEFLKPPEAPTQMELISPANSSDFSESIIIKVDGVLERDKVHLFKDSSCTEEVISKVSDGESVNVAIDDLAAGSHTFYAQVTDAFNLKSPCSTVSISYTKNFCPPDYVEVKGRPYLGTTNNFCVMKFEAKNVGGVATSQAAGLPWVSIEQPVAKDKCLDLGDGYDLISNPEFMTILHDAESGDENWTGDAVASGKMYRGHTNNSGNKPVSDETNPYSDTGDTSTGTGKDQRRTFILSNGSVVWDIAGNVWEYVDWTLGGALTTGPTTCSESWRQLTSVNCGALSAVDYMPGNPAGVPASTYNSNFGLGYYIGGSGGAGVRGGNPTYNSYSGAFALGTIYTPTYDLPIIGFRCVYRP